MATVPACKRTMSFLRHYDRHVLAALTGQDKRALDAFSHLLELYAVADGDGRDAALSAMRSTIRAMQPSTRYIAKGAIPSQLDWGDEEPLWAKLAPSAHGEGT